MNKWLIMSSLELMSNTVLYFSVLQIAVRDFTKMCKHLGIQATLIDPGTLKHLITRLQSSSSVNKSSFYSHGNCHYFCDNKYYSFGIFGSELQDKEILVSSVCLDFKPLM